MLVKLYVPGATSRAIEKESMMAHGQGSASFARDKQLGYGRCVAGQLIGRHDLDDFGRRPRHKRILVKKQSSNCVVACQLGRSNVDW